MKKQNNPLFKLKKQLKKSFQPKKILLVTSLNSLFWFLSFTLIMTLSKSLSSYSKKVEKILNNIQIQGSLDLTSSQLAQESMKTLIIKFGIYSLIGIIGVFLLYVLLKGTSYQIIRNRKVNIKELRWYKKFAVFSIFWFIFGTFIFSFVIFLLITFQNIESSLISIGILFSLFIIAFFSYLSMCSNLHFSKTKKIRSFFDGMLNALNLKKTFFPILLFVIIFILFNILFTSIYRWFLPSDSIYYGFFGFFLILQIAWFRIFIDDKINDNSNK